MAKPHFPGLEKCIELPSRVPFPPEEARVGRLLTPVRSHILSHVIDSCLN
jgi:hypothetical protein